MTPSPFLSIIIPAYNVEKYIGECLNSLKLLFNNSRIEIIVVNDGSTDSTESIARSILAKVTNAVIFTKKNGGLASARNFGVSKSIGEWLWFVDSDDLTYNCQYWLTFNFSQVSKINLIHFKIKKLNDNTKEIKNDTTWVLNKKTGFEYSIANYKKIPIEFSPWSKLFRRKIFEDISWPNILYEDLFMCSHLMKNNTIYYVNEYLYVYRVFREGSILNITRKLSCSKFIEFIKSTKNLDYKIAGTYLLTVKMPNLTKSEKNFYKSLFKEHSNEILYRWFFKRNFLYKMAYLCLKMHLFKLFSLIQRNRKTTQ